MQASLINDYRSTCFQAQTIVYLVSGGLSVVVRPDPISNSVVKRYSGDNNGDASLCEDSSLPDSIKPSLKEGFLLDKHTPRPRLGVLLPTNKTMPAKNSRKQYIENSYYHVYNRGVEKRIIFIDEQDVKVFLKYFKE